MIVFIAIYYHFKRNIVTITFKLHVLEAKNKKRKYNNIISFKLLDLEKFLIFLIKLCAVFGKES